MKKQPRNTKPKDLTGKVINKLTVVSLESVEKVLYKDFYKTRSTWNCKCECGRTGIVTCRGLGASPECLKGCTNRIKVKPVKEPKRLAPGESALNNLFGKYKARAEQRGHDFKLSKERFRELTSANCHYCGVVPSQSAYSNGYRTSDYTYNGIDRKDNNEGYIEGNVLTCCKDCNFSKRDMSYEKFVDYHNRIVNFKTSNENKG